MLLDVDYTEILKDYIMELYKKEGTLINLDTTLLYSYLIQIQPTLEQRKKLYNRYLGKDLPILEKKNDNINKENNILVNNFRPVIVDQKVGYIFGSRIEKTIEEKTANEQIQSFLQEIDTDADAELGKYASICGCSFGLIYLKNADGVAIPDMVLIKPWEVEVLFNNDTQEIGIRFISKYSYTEKKVIKLIEIYYLNICTVFKLIDNKFSVLEEVLSGFNVQPIVCFLNNTDVRSDFEPIETLCDAYDTLLSGRQDDIREISSALMALSGVDDFPKEEVIKAKTSGFIMLPDGGSATYIKKELDNLSVENQLKILKENIFKFTHSIDITDSTFTTPESGTARQLKFQELETKSKTMETKFITGYRYMFKILEGYYLSLGIKFDSKKVKITFGRSFKELPMDVTELTNILINLYNNKLISAKTVRENIPFINSNLEKERLKEEISVLNTDTNIDVNTDTDTNVDNNTEETGIVKKIQNIFKK